MSSGESLYLQESAAVAEGAAGEACGRPSARRCIDLVTSLREALQAAALLAEEREEQHGGVVVLEVDREGALRAAAPGNIAPTSGHEDLPEGNGSNLRSGRWGVAVGVLQPKLAKAPRQHLGGEEAGEA